MPELNLTPHSLPTLSIEGAETVGLLRDFDEQQIEAYERLAGYKDIGDENAFPSRNFSAGQFGLSTTMSLYVLGRSGGNYFLSIRDFGDPVFSVPESVLDSMGFEASRFNWAKPQEQIED